MRGKALVAVLALALSACAGQSSSHREAGAPPPPVHAGDYAVSAVGTPFYLAFKAPVCVATVAVSGPLAGLFALAGEEHGQRALGYGVARNCGPPYVLSPGE